MAHFFFISDSNDNLIIIDTYNTDHLLLANIEKDIITEAVKISELPVWFFKHLPYIDEKL